MKLKSTRCFCTNYEVFKDGIRGYLCVYSREDSPAVADAVRDAGYTDARRTGGDFVREPFLPEVRERVTDALRASAETGAAVPFAVVPLMCDYYHTCAYGFDDGSEGYRHDHVISPKYYLAENGKLLFNHLARRDAAYHDLTGFDRQESYHYSSSVYDSIFLDGVFDSENPASV